MQYPSGQYAQQQQNGSKIAAEGLAVIDTVHPRYLIFRSGNLTASLNLMKRNVALLLSPVASATSSPIEPGTALAKIFETATPEAGGLSRVRCNE
ncbi:MAG: hypothetical protein CMLOHMNK_00547 [Steroidobacteraceae bacterium]|nr:hypothetical protein [Steroidobacteraceae bacterium]